MKIRVNSKILAGLNPCQDRWNNWSTHYANFDKDITHFLKLNNISYSDKIWVCKKLVPIDILVVFALDCSFTAAAAADAAASAADAYAADVAAYAADAYASYASYAADAASAADTAANAANAAAYAYAYVPAYAATNVAANAANAAYSYASYAASAAEQNRQIETLIYLIKGEK